MIWYNPIVTLRCVVWSNGEISTSDGCNLILEECYEGWISRSAAWTGAIGTRIDRFVEVMLFHHSPGPYTKDSCEICLIDVDNPESVDLEVVGFLRNGHCNNLVPSV